MEIMKNKLKPDDVFFLDHLYFLCSKVPGWVFRLQNLLELNDEEVRYLELLDDVFMSSDAAHDKMIRSMNIEVVSGVLFAESDDEKIRILSQRINDLYDEYESMRQSDIDYPTRKVFLGICDLETMERMKKILVGKRWRKNAPTDGRITDYDIERARNYPLEKLVETGIHGRLPCPFHKGNNKNAAVIKNNFFYCFNCGEWADPIKWIMNMENLSFVQAVRRLS